MTNSKLISTALKNDNYTLEVFGDNTASLDVLKTNSQTRIWFGFTICFGKEEISKQMYSYSNMGLTELIHERSIKVWIEEVHNHEDELVEMEAENLKQLLELIESELYNK